MKIVGVVLLGLSVGASACGSSSAGGASNGGASNGGASNGGASNGGTSNAGRSNGGTSNGGTSTGGTSTGGTSTGGTSEAGAAGAPSDGSSNPMPFTPVSQLWIGAPDDPATIVVYVFSKPTACSAISAAGWDAKLAPATQQLEMKDFGSTPGTYQVVTTKTPAPGEASVNYNTNGSGTPVETSITGGTVTLQAVNAKKNVTGSYALTFGGTHLDGTFDASYCAGGVEP